ncbi:MAG TPA: alpha/beta hydrolase [Gemmatimonadaceae bacterium]|nr:alpha/beta hydrolase [Gemmatimonadaceae bacterium]
MDTYVLVHGAWAGGWIWREIADRLRAEGHRVFTPTLTGLGERSHLIGTGVTLTTHALDIANLIEWEELSGVVLVGHSYGGMAITAATELVPEGAIKSIVYLDAFLPDDGQSLTDLVPAGAAPGPEFSRDPIPFPGLGRTGDARLERLVTPHPLATVTERVRLTGALSRIPVKTYVLATGGPQPTLFAAMADKIATDPAWRVERLACGHNLMMEKPRETLDILLRAAARAIGQSG